MNRDFNERGLDRFMLPHSLLERTCVMKKTKTSGRPNRAKAVARPRIDAQAEVRFGSIDGLFSVECEQHAIYYRVGPGRLDVTGHPGARDTTQVADNTLAVRDFLLLQNPMSSRLTRVLGELDIPFSQFCDAQKD